jgi:hypothetical protein
MNRYTSIVHRHLIGRTNTHGQVRLFILLSFLLPWALGLTLSVQMSQISDIWAQRQSRIFVTWLTGETGVIGLSDLITLYILWCLDCKQTQRAFNVFKNTLNWLKIDSVDQKLFKIQLTREWEILTRCWNVWHSERHCVFTAGGERVKKRSLMKRLKWRKKWDNDGITFSSQVEHAGNFCRHQEQKNWYKYGGWCVRHVTAKDKQPPLTMRHNWAWEDHNEQGIVAILASRDTWVHYILIEPITCTYIFPKGYSGM